MFLLFRCAMVCWIALGSLTYAQTLVRVQQKEREVNFPMTLVESSKSLNDKDRQDTVAGTPLSPEEIQALRDQLPPMDFEEDGPELFRPIETRLSPPNKISPMNTDSVRDVPKPEVLPEDLTVVRYSPSGQLAAVGAVVLVFNQPMVALTTLGDLDQAIPDISISPDVGGQWHWISPTTLMYLRNTEFPRSTAYEVRLESATSLSGSSLREPLHFSFSTRTLRVKVDYPHEEAILDSGSMLLLSFDQEVNANDMLPFLHLDADGQRVPLEIMTEEDWQSPQIEHYKEQQGYQLGWRIGKLPVSAEATLTLDEGAPSAEGPLTSTRPFSFSFTTRGPLRFVRANCGYGNKCQPGQSWDLVFNNALNAESLTREMIRIEPELPDFEYLVFDKYIQIEGSGRSNTAYTISIAAGLRDAAGSRLDEEVTAQFSLDPSPPMVNLGARFQILDPAGPPAVFVSSLNQARIPVKIFRVAASDYEAYNTFRPHQKKSSPPGELIAEQRIVPASNPDNIVLTEIDLSPYLEGGNQFIVQAEGANKFNNPITWVQRTALAADTFGDQHNLYVWITDQKDGRPLPGARAEIVSQRGLGVLSSATADNDGIATLPLVTSPNKILRITHQGDQLVLPTHNWNRSADDGGIRIYTTDGCSLFRIGETVHIKGWARLLEKPTQPRFPRGGSLDYVLSDGFRQILTQGTFELDEHGGFQLELTLPEGMNLGQALLEIKQKNKVLATHTFMVDAFRTPEFELDLEVSAGPYFAGDSLRGAATAVYYSGAALPDASISWTARAESTRYNPPNWQGYVFGEWIPWWRQASYDQDEEQLHGTCDSEGHHGVQLQTGRPENGLPVQLTVRAEAADLNNQFASASQSIVIHPSEFYVGLRSEQYFVGEGEPLAFRLVVSDIAGHPLDQARVDLLAVREEWVYEEGSWRQKDEGAWEQEVSFQGEPVAFEVPTPRAGTYRIEARVRDGQGRESRTTMRRWVTGRLATRSVEGKQVTLIPAQRTLDPGQSTEIMVISPFHPAYGLLQIRQENKVLRLVPFEVSSGSTSIDLSTESSWLGQIQVSVLLLGQEIPESGKDTPTPAFARGDTTIDLSLKQRSLAVAVAPEPQATRPGESVSLDIRVTDSSGMPVSSADLAVFVVDEAILGLAHFQLENPLDLFYRVQNYAPNYNHSRELVRLSSDDHLMAAVDEPAMEMQSMRAMAPMGGMSGDDGEGVKLRDDFRGLAAWFPEARPDQDGTCKLSFDLPDNLTRFRVMVIAADEARFGIGESDITTRLPLIIAPSLPRFLNLGDQFDLPIVVRNQTDKPLDVRLALETQGLELSQSEGRQVTIPPLDRVRLLFPARATTAGVARIRSVAICDEGSDAIDLEVPIYTPIEEEAFAAYGSLDDGNVANRLELPDNLWLDEGGLTFTASTSLFGDLDLAWNYVEKYPYNCTEQIASRVLAGTAMLSLGPAFDPDFDLDDLLDKIEDDIDELSKRLINEGFSVWPDYRMGNNPYLSVHAAHAVRRAWEADVEVPEQMIMSILKYLTEISTHVERARYGARQAFTTKAYALAVLYMAEDNVALRAQQLLDAQPLSETTPEGLGWLLPMLDDAHAQKVLRHLENQVTETAEKAHFISKYEEGGSLVMHSNYRDDAILLGGLMDADENSDLIPKLLKGLLSARKRGIWSNTQENALALITLTEYFLRYEKEEPQLDANLWFDDQLLAQHRFRGRETRRYQHFVPMTWLQQEGAGDVLLAHEGQGRLYYRLGLNYASKEPDPKPIDRGFFIQRRYEAVDDPEDVTRAEDGTWLVREGAEIKVILEMSASSFRSHVALVDHLPAGLEIIQVNQTGDPGRRNNLPRFSSYFWYEHFNKHDDRLELFSSRLEAGNYITQYFARATTPGSYSAPPTTAEEMYSPETFGRGAFQRMRIIKKAP